MEVIKRVRQKVGRDFPIEYRISGDELLEGGMKIDQTVEYAKMIEDSIDLIHVSAGVHFIMPLNRRMFPIVGFAEPGCNVYLAAEMKKHVRYQSRRWAASTRRNTPSSYWPKARPTSSAWAGS